MGLVDRVAVEAGKVRPLGVLLWVLAAPFFVVGCLVAVVWVAVLFAFGAVRVGFVEGRAKVSPAKVEARP